MMSVMFLLPRECYCVSKVRISSWLFVLSFPGWQLTAVSRFWGWSRVVLDIRNFTELYASRGSILIFQSLTSYKTRLDNPKNWKEVRYGYISDISRDSFT
ncbi:hypothetical protein GALMADRAFT_1210561 [Galerina marginata CBS 339.88]|uniref:Uncharacterized protein n=1 Tax=Galerina marginata (strain CBS 339.88) TaxID=685588 RepID=A0A067S7X2_GALM3|nr:hypothetical protein GALMADRAFT_1210561 [Galerina marginata CBS 339.88]